MHCPNSLRQGPPSAAKPTRASPNALLSPKPHAAPKDSLLCSVPVPAAAAAINPSNISINVLGRGNTRISYSSTPASAAAKTIASASPPSLSTRPNANASRPVYTFPCANSSIGPDNFDPRDAATRDLNTSYTISR